jgi:hypothetical protein
MASISGICQLLAHGIFLEFAKDLFVPLLIVGQELRLHLDASAGNRVILG